MSRGARSGVRYGRDRPLWRQRRWWQDGVVFALAFPLVLTALGAAGGPFGGAAPSPDTLAGYLLEVAAALGGWGLIGWAASRRPEESRGARTALPERSDDAGNARIDHPEVTEMSADAHSDAARSPRIEGVSWGEVRVEGASAPYRDAKTWPGGSRGWDWDETGTSHTPGIQPEDVEELLENGAEEIVLGRGMNERLQVMDETLQMLERRNIPAHVLPTDEAVELYNDLADDEPVGGLFHSTC